MIFGYGIVIRERNHDYNNGIFRRISIDDFSKQRFDLNEILKRIRELFERSLQEKMRVYIYIYNMIELAAIEEFKG